MIPAERMDDEGVRRLLVKVAWQACRDYRDAWKARREAVVRIHQLQESKPGRRTEKAIKDYMEKRDVPRIAAINVLLGNANQKKNTATATLKEIERYFMSDMFEEATGYSGDIAIAKLREDLRRKGWSGISILDKEIDE